MIDDDLRDHLAAGVSIIVGSVSPAGQPHASRGYGAEPVGDDRLRVFLDARDATVIENVQATGRIAVTTGDQRTFRSVQFKGCVEGIAEASGHEHAAALAHMKRFWDRVTFEDNISRRTLERGTPTAFVTCTMRVESMFDQTPGPSAGGAIEVTPQ